MNEHRLSECKTKMKLNTVIFRQEFSQVICRFDQSWELHSHSVQNRLYKS
jgi:hypothetical protein